MPTNQQIRIIVLLIAGLNNCFSNNNSMGCVDWDLYFTVFVGRRRYYRYKNAHGHMTSFILYYSYFKLSCNTLKSIK